MSIKLKIALIVLGIFVSFGAINYGIQRFTILTSFIELECDEARKDLERSVKAIKNEIHHLYTLCLDWASWDDTYDFVESQSKEYIKSNLPLSTFTGNELNIIYIIDKDGKVAWGKIYDLETEEAMRLTEFPKHAFPKTHPLISYKTGKRPLSEIGISGVFMTEKGPMLISSLPILTSNDKGPMRGSLIMGRFLNENVVNTLIDQTQVPFKVFPIQGNSLPKSIKEIPSRVTTESPYLIEKKDGDNLLVYTVYPDVNGNAALVIRAIIPMEISVRGYTTLRQTLMWTSISALVVFIVLLLLLQRTILSPIAALASHALSVGKSGDLSMRLSVQRRDEIGTLVTEFDRMLANLEKQTSELANVNAELKNDINKRKRAEEALRESKTQMQGLLNGLPDMIIQIDCNMRILWANRTALDMNPDAVSLTCHKAYVNRDKSCQDCPCKKCMDTGQIETEIIYQPATKGIRGESYWENIGVPIKNNDDRIEGSIKIARNVTERRLAEKEKRKLQAQLQRAQKMEAIGTLAGGIAHDLNNVLSGIVSYPELLLMKMPEDSPLRNPILTIQRSGQKAAAIVQDMLTLARRGVLATEVISLNQIIDGYLNSPEYENLKEFHPDIKIESNLETHLLNIMGSSVHLSKTVMNLVANAAEAMPDGGNVLISTENKYIDKPIGGYDNVKEGDYVVLTISDTGVGIPSEDIEKIFEPFYTKKKMGKSGTGLGMAVVWGTVKDHKGYVDVQSAEGKGTTFTLYFPVTRKEMSEKEKVLSMEQYTGNGESILVVDDVEEQRKIASQILRKLGYSVTSVSSGEEAVAYMKDDSADLLVLDMIMDPGIDGLDTYRQILEFHPKQKAIIASGFSETDRIREAQRLGAGKYVKKPYTMEKIGLAAKEELEKGKSLV